MKVASNSYVVLGDTASVEDLPKPRYTQSCFYGAFCLCTDEFSPSHEWIVAGPVRNVITPLDNTENGRGCLALSGLPQEPLDWVETTD